jgi:hypothetical protein
MSNAANSRVVIGAAVIAVVCAGIGIVLTALHWMHGAAWEVEDIVLVVVAWTGDVLGFAIGLWWWWWRAPANPTGRLLYLSALSDSDHRPAAQRRHGEDLDPVGPTTSPHPATYAAQSCSPTSPPSATSRRCVRAGRCRA